MEMGCGKTITSIAIAGILHQYRYIKKILLTAPLSILGVWEQEFARFADFHFTLTVLKGSISQKKEQLKKLHSIAYRVTKAECLDLPEITEEIRTVGLEPKAMKLYKQLEKENFAELAGSEVSAMNVLTKMLRLSQMTDGHLTDDEGDTNSVSTAKLEALSDILDTMLAEDKKLVIMARFVPELNDIQKLLEKKNIGYASVRGGISDRAEEIRRFQKYADCRVFVGQIAAAGLGITLAAASTIVFYSLYY